MCDNDDNFCWPVTKTMEHDESGEQIMVCQGVYISKMKMMKMMTMVKIIVIWFFDLMEMMENRTRAKSDAFSLFR